MTAWLLLDSFIERAMLLQLTERERMGLLAVLTGYGLAGVAGAVIWPGSAGLCLIFPYMTLIFFQGRLALVTLPALAALHACLVPGLPASLIFAAAAGLGTLFGLVTASRYRQSRLQQMELERSLHLAREVQCGLEPPTRLQLQELEVNTYMRVSNRLGGDFMAMRVLGEGRLSFVQGDVMGKGLQASILAAYLVGVYEQLAGQGLSPAQIAKAMNERLDGPTFATLLVLEVDLNEHSWRLCRAGHEYPLLRRANGQLLELSEAGGIPIGIERETTYSERTHELRSGDRLLLTTDGIWETAVTPADLVAALSQPEPLDPISERLQSLEPRDDISLALLRIAG